MSIYESDSAKETDLDQIFHVALQILTLERQSEFQKVAIEKIFYFLEYNKISYYRTLKKVSYF